LADGKAPDEVSVAVGDSIPASAAPVVLNTPLLSVRRAPAVLSRDSNSAAFRSELQPLLDTLDGNSCFAVSIDGEPVASVNETVPLRPASNVKLITASVALEVLGESFVYTTTVNGQVGAGGAVAGNLYLVGGGDPVLSSAWWDGPNQKFPPINVTSIEALADSIKAAGVTSVGGSIVGDASRYDDEWYLPTWAPALRFSEGGPLSALLVNDSREAPDRSSNDPVVGAATVLTQLLQERGITVVGAPAEGTSDGSPVVASIDSRPLPAMLQEMLTTSDNNTAELVLKEIGLVASGEGTTVAGLAKVMSTLQEWGIPLDGVTLVDGSGLSDENRLTCQALLAVLQHGSVDDAVGQGLPVGGAKGGTLYDAFQEGEPLSGVLRAKTGTLDNTDGVADKLGAKSLSGYVPLAGGGTIEFSLLLNGETITNKTEYRPTWEMLASILAAYPSGPTAETLAPR
jgi:D-alanyl-D-alanine carboxypeptidase/D-alanyl-D-alanine-endopeptidase (penicillin-binding protein 4)